MKNILQSILLISTLLFCLPHLLHAQCNNGETYNSYCYGPGENDVVAFQFCPDAGTTAQARILQGGFTGPNDNLTVYSGAFNSGTGGIVVFGPISGDLTGQVIDAANPSDCLIFVVNSRMNTGRDPIGCVANGGLEDELQVCSQSIQGQQLTFTALEDLSVNAGVQSGLSGGSPQGGVYCGPGVTDNNNGMTYSFDPAAAGVDTHTLKYTLNGDTARDDVVVLNLLPPNFSKSFAPDEIGVDATTVLTFTIDNTNTGMPTTDLAFVDNLPVGLTVAAFPNIQNSCTDGTVMANPGSASISYSGGRIGGNSSCSISVNVKADNTAGVKTNTTGDLTSFAGNSGTATDVLTVFDGTDRPLFSKVFSPSTVNFGERSTLTFTIDNSNNSDPALSINFQDNLPTGMVIALPSNASTTCNGGSINAIPGSNFISYSPTFPGDASIIGGSTCVVSVDVEAVSTGTQLNISEEMTSSDVLFGSTRSSGIAVAALEVTQNEQIFIDKTFETNPVRPGGTTMLTFTLQNFNRNSSAINVAFTDDLDAMLTGVVAVGTPINACGGTLDGTSTLTFSGGTLDPGGTCTFSIPVQIPAGASVGTYTNTTSAPTADIEGRSVAGNPTSENLFVTNLPRISKTFLDNPILAGDTSTLEFKIVNTSDVSALTDVDFTDNISAFLSGATLVNVPAAGSCGAGSFFFQGPFNGELIFNVLDANVPASDSCTFTIDITTPVNTPTASYTNTTSFIEGEVDGSSFISEPVSDDLLINALPRLRKSFDNDPVLAGETVDLTFTITYDADATLDATNLNFTDDLNAALNGLSYTGPTLNDICGTGSQLSGMSTLSFTGGSLTPGGSCTFTIPVEVPASALPGSYTNTTSPLNATIGGETADGSTATDELEVGGLTLTKAFIGNPVLPGELTTLRFTIENETSFPAISVFFTDNLNNVLPGLAAEGLPLTDLCGAGSQISGTTFLIFTGGNLPANSSCTFDVPVRVPSNADNGTYSNVTSNLTAIIDGSAVVVDPAVDQLVVDNVRLQLTKSFTDDPVMPGDMVTLEFTLTNLDPNNAVSNIAFTDDLDAVLTGLAATGLPKSVAGGTLNGTSLISLSGASLMAGQSVTFSVDVMVPANATPGGSFNNITSDVTGEINAIPVVGTPASDDLFIGAFTLTKSFDANTATAGDTVTLTFNLMNESTETISDIEFTDDINAFIPGATIVSLPNNVGTCGRGAGVSGTTELTFARGDLGANSSCSFEIKVLIPCEATTDEYINSTSTVNYSAGTAPPAIDTLSVNNPPPTARCQNITVYLDDNGQASISPEDVDNGSTDNCPLIDSMLTSSDFDCNDIGTFADTLIVTAAGNSMDSCVFDVTVLDTIPPTITFCPGESEVMVGMPTDTMALGFAQADDNCMLDSIAFRDDSTGFVNGLPIGVITRTFIAVDESGNMDSCSQEITVTSEAIFIRMLLSGPLGLNSGSNPPVMWDSLRSKGFIPLTSPYGTGEMISDSATVLADLGNSSIVDWVLIELRNRLNPAIVVASRSALVQRNGNVVDTNGMDGVIFDMADLLGQDSFFVAVQHRNHLGAMTDELYAANGSLVDFTDVNEDFYSEGFAPQDSIIWLNQYALWPGNANQDRQVDAGDEEPIVRRKVLTASQNTFNLVNYIRMGYFLEDVNMDGSVIYAGQRNDIDVILDAIYRHPQNGAQDPGFVIPEQLPSP